MKTISTLWPALAACALVAALFRPAAAMIDDPTPRVDVDRPVALRIGVLPAPVLDVEVATALHYWTRRPIDVLRPWANAIVAVARDRAEAIWLASQAAVEGGFAPYVLDFHCNKPSEFHDFPARACDNSWAVGPWQRHSRVLIGAAPARLAADALQWMRTCPRAWTTWREARQMADQWISRNMQ